MKNPTFLVMGGLLAACSTNPTAEQLPPTGPRFERFVPDRSSYQLTPGDQLEITVHGAPEMSRSVTIGPDGRITMPLVPPIMVADLTINQARQAVMQGMAIALVDPRLDVSVSGYGPQQIFVGGEVGQPGILEIPGQIDALQAIIMAGGFTDRSSRNQVIMLRREPRGEVQSYSFDVQTGIYNPELARFGPLQKFDVIYVPKSRIAQHNLFLRQFVFEGLPVNFSLYYDLGDSRNF